MEGGIWRGGRKKRIPLFARNVMLLPCCASPSDRNDLSYEGGYFGFVGIADDMGDAGKDGQFFGGALRVAPGDDQAGVGILRVDFADGVAGLGVGGSGHRAGVEDNDGGGGGVGGSRAAAVKELAF